MLACNVIGITGIGLPVSPPAGRGAWICAAVVFAAGLAASTLRGARTTLTDNNG